MKNISRLKQLLVMLSCLVGFGFMINGQAALRANKVTVLFVLSAKKGVIHKVSKSHTLALTGLDRHVLWFTDRPNRKAGFVSSQKFIAEWSRNFKEDAPNAGLVHAGMSYARGGKQVPLAVELKNPTIKNGVLYFKINSISGHRLGRTMVLNKVTIFFDGIGRLFLLRRPPGREAYPGDVF